MSTISTTAAQSAPVSSPTWSWTDSGIRDGVEAALAASAIAGERNIIRVSVHGGHVLLTGRLARRSHLALATRLAGAVPGAVDVHNRLDYVWRD